MREAILALLALWSQGFASYPVWTTLAGVAVAVAALAIVGRSVRGHMQLTAGVSGGPLLLVAALGVMIVCFLWAAIDGLLAWADAPLLGQRLLRMLVPEGLSLGGLGALLGATGPALPGAADLSPDALAQLGLSPDALAQLSPDALAQLGLSPDALAQLGLSPDALAQLGLPIGGLADLRLPPGVTMPIGLIAATGLYLLIARVLGSTLSEMIALQTKPDDVVRAERRKAREAEARARAEAEAQEATAGADDDAEPDAADTGAATPPPAEASDPPDADEDEPPAATTGRLGNDGFGRLYQLAGHFHDHVRIEPRAARWLIPLGVSLLTMSGLGALAAGNGHLPVPLWVSVTVFAVALRQLMPMNSPAPAPAQDAPAPPDGDSEPATRPGARLAFAARTAVAPRLAPAPRAAPPTPARERTPRVHAPRLLDSITRALGAPRLHPHQAAALSAFNAHDSVLLCTPPGSGRELLTDALTLYTLLADGQRVLHLSPDATSARAAKARFDERAEATHWKWNVLAANLADRAGILDPAQSQPALVFADPDALHRQLCGQRTRWQPFLAGLGAILLPDIHGYAGVPAAHLAHLLRRLERAVRHARSPAAGAVLLAEPAGSALPRMLLTANPAHDNLGRFAERLVGRPVQIIGPGHDGAPRPRQDPRVIADGWPAGSAHPALALRDLARRMGYTVALHGYDDLLTAAERDESVLPAQAEVVIARLTAATYAGLPLATAHMGARRPPARGFLPSTAVLWQPDPAPLARFLAAHRPPVDDPERAALPALVAAPAAPAVERSHLRASLAESEISLDELARTFSRDGLEAELAALEAQGRLIHRQRRLLDAEAGVVRSIRTIALTRGDDVHAGMSLCTTAEPWHVCERATGDILCALEGPRARAAAYPQRVLVARGRRFTVLADDDQDQLDRRRILCEQSDAAVLSTPVRTWHLELIERRKDTGDARVERRRSALRSLGGARFSFQHRAVRVTETVLGVRRLDLHGRPLDTTLYDQPIACTYDSRAAVLGLVPDDLPGEKDISDDTLHAVEHGLGQALGALIHHGQDDLHIVALTPSAAFASPTLAFVDLHPGGAGFADAVTLDVLRRMATFALALIRACPERCATGCAACLRTLTCDAPGERHQRLDRAGAEALLAAVLGQAADSRAG